MEPVPISNIGLGNYIDPQTGRLYKPLSPYNVLEPLRRVFPVYLPWWHRRLLNLAKAEPISLTSSASNTNFAYAEKSEQEQIIKRSHIGCAFISYRREGSAETARLIRTELSARGWRAFLDVEDLGASCFDQSLWLEINAAENFVLILYPGCLDRCLDERDWFRREIAYALSTGKNIVPILKDGFSFPSIELLPTDIRELIKYNSVEYSHIYFNATIEKLVSFLKAQMKQ